MSDTTRAIDMWAPIVPAREIMEWAADHFPLPQLGYLRVFFKSEPTAETFRRLALSLASDDEQVLAALDAVRGPATRLRAR